MQASITARIAALQRMTTAELREEWRRVMNEQPHSYHRTWLWRRLAWAIQAKEFGGLSERAKRRLEELTPEAEAWMPLGKRAFKGTPSPAPDQPGRDARLPSPGTVLTRHYKGRTITVTAREDGFEFDGTLYATLSAIAKAVTGSHWNGFHFFRLGQKGDAA